MVFQEFSIMMHYRAIIGGIPACLGTINEILSFLEVDLISA